MKKRAVVVAGVRTPFVKAFGAYTKMDTIALGDAAVAALLERTGLPRRELDSLIWGGVILPGMAPNVGREIVLDLKLPPETEAMTVTRACASGLQAITLAAAAIERGEADVVIAGGSDSTSNAELKMPQSLVHKLAPVAMSSKSGPRDYLRVLGKISIRKDLIPRQLMGEAAEEMAERNGVTREEQDAFAVRSHHRAAEAIRSGRFDREVVPARNERGETVYTDTLVRGDTSTEKLAKLKAVFKPGG